MEIDKNKYHHSKIYRITDNNYTKFYYGSTTKALSARMAEHRYAYKSGFLNSTSKVLFDEFGVDNTKIELVEAVQCENRDELRKIEGKFIQENQCVNKYVAGRSKKESNNISSAKYYEGHREERLKKHRELYKLKKDQWSAVQNRKWTCECGMVVSFRQKKIHITTARHNKKMLSRINKND